MDIADKYIAKSGKFKGLKDCGDTWRDLYRKGGEDLLREYSAHMTTEHNYFRGEPDDGFMKRLCMVVTRIYLTEEEAWYFAFKRLPPSERCYLAFNKHCPEDLLEAIWFGDYLKLDGTPDPDAVAGHAYFNNYRKALSVYARRPDIRANSSRAVRKIYDYSLRYEGIVPLGDEQNYSVPDIEKIIKILI